MTKKSDARLKRDASAAAIQKQNVHSPYQDLEDQYKVHTGLFKPYLDMAAIIENPAVTPFMPNLEHVLNLTRTLRADVADLRSRTEALYAKHAGKANMPDMLDADENFELVMLFQDYQILFAVHQQTVIPIMTQLDEYLAVALKAKKLAEDDVAAQNAALAPAQ